MLILVYMRKQLKFFDYVIPIVPVVDSSNSYEQFLKHLKAGKLIDKFDQSFLQSLSLYVDDMRILKNIYNEFVIPFHASAPQYTEVRCEFPARTILRRFYLHQIAGGFHRKLL